MIALIKKIFNRHAPPVPLSEAEQALKGWGVEYQKQQNGMIVVEGNIDISNKGLTRLPDLSKVIVKGSFICDSNLLTTLHGAPASIGGDFSCGSNYLTTLHGAPVSVGGDFSCFNNKLTSLQGAPVSVGGGFQCHYNQLITLQGAPASVGGYFWCRDNPALKNLEGAPQRFQTLHSPFGDFPTWEEVPENLRFSPETIRKQREKEQRKREQNIHDSVYLKKDIEIAPPFKLKKQEQKP